MTVLIHPVLAKADAQHTLRKMEFNFGLRATASGHFVLPNGEHPKMRAPKAARMYAVAPRGPFNGGDAA
jgi:hypothetical protein